MHIARNPAALQLQIITLDEVKESATYFHSLFQEHLASAIGLLKEKVVNVPCINSNAVKMDIDTELRETANFFWKVIKLKKIKQKPTPVGVCWASARKLMYKGDRDWERKTVYYIGQSERESKAVYYIGR